MVIRRFRIPRREGIFMNRLITISVCLILAGSGCGKSAGSRLSAVSIHLVSAKDSPDDFKVRAAGNRETLYLEKKPQLTLEDIASVRAQIIGGSAGSQDDDGLYEIILQFEPQAKEKLYRITAGNRGRRLAVLINGAYICAPVIMAPIARGRVSLQNRFNRQQAFSLAEFITIAKRRSLVPEKEAFERGIVYARKADYDEAIFYFTRAIQYDPACARAYYNRGLARGTKGEYGKALADFAKAIEIDPGYAKAYRDRGVAYTRNKEYQKAFYDVNRAIELNPKDWYAYFMRGCIYMRARTYAGASGDFSKTIALYPRYAPAYVRRGIARYSMGRFQEAFADLSAAAAISRDASIYKDFIIAIPARNPSDTGDEYGKILELFRPGRAASKQN